MVSEEYKVSAAKAYLQHVRDICELMALMDTTMFLARYNGMNDKDFYREQERRLDRYAAERRRALRAIDDVADCDYGVPRDVMRMWVFEGKSYETIGDELGYEVSTIKRAMKKGRKRLYDVMPIEYK